MFPALISICSFVTECFRNAAGGQGTSDVLVLRMHSYQSKSDAQSFARQEVTAEYRL